MQKKFLIIFIFILILFTGCKIKQPLNPVPVKEDEPVVENYSFSFIGAGDALLHEGIYMTAATGKYGKNGQIYNFLPQFSHIKEIIKPYDLKFYNQETIIGGKSRGLSGYPCFNSPDEIGEDLVDIGFNIVNLASNHTYDVGAEGVKYSTSYWAKKKKVYAVGSYSSQKARDEVIVKRMNGITYSVLSYTYGTNGIYVPEQNKYMVNVWSTEKEADYQAYKAQVKKDIKAVRDKVDVLMVSMHWGNEYQHVPSSYQKDMAKYLASLDVDVIIGHHPHVIQPIEYIGDTVVIYSLGNMISWQEGTQKLIGMMAAFTANKTVVDGVTTDVNISDVKADLIWTHHGSIGDVKVIPFNKMTDTYLYNYRGVYSEYKKMINPKGDKRVQVGFFK